MRSVGKNHPAEQIHEKKILLERFFFLSGQKTRSNHWPPTAPKTNKLATERTI